MAKLSRAEEFVGLLQATGLLRSELARRLGLHRNTVSKWGDDVPEYALAYLRLLAGLQSVLAATPRVPYAR